MGRTSPSCPLPAARARLAALAILALITLAPAARCGAQTVDTRFPGVDGHIDAFLVTGDTLYVGGSFLGFGPVTGGGALLALDTGALLPGRFPLVDGQVYGAIPDGAGGWYVCGQFLHVGGIARDNLAHVLADGTVAPWDPGARDNSGHANNVYPIALALQGNTVYVGGWFTRIGQERRPGLAAVDAVTGAVRDWAPNPDNAVDALCVKGGRLFVGGRFHSIAGARRAYLAAFDTRDGALAEWAPEMGSGVQALAAAGHTLYAGGGFTLVNGRPRGRAAAFDLRSGDLLPWDPRADGEIRACEARGNAVFVGGAFTALGGQPRRYLAALDAASGDALPWASSDLPGSVRGLALQDDRLYATAGRNVVAVDASSGRLAWSQPLFGEGHIVSPSGAGLLVGGDFSSVGPRLARRNLAAFDLRTGELLPWTPRLDGEVFALARCGGAIWAGGAFHLAGRATHEHLAAFDPATADALDRTPQADDVVRALAARGDTLFVGGDFARLGAEPRARLAALDARAGAMMAWDPGANGAVRCLATRGAAIYAGGSFTAAGGGTGTTGRLGAAAFGVADGALLPWDPRAEFRGDFINGPESVNALVAGERIFLGGGFNLIGGQFRPALASVDPVTGAPDAWNPAAYRYNDHPVVAALAVADGFVYAGGMFAGIGVQWCYGFGGVDATTGAPTSWTPAMEGVADALGTDGTLLFVSGEFFYGLCGLPCGNFAVVRLGEQATAAARPGAMPAEAARQACALALLCGPNPARDATSLRFTLPRSATATLVVYDLTGRRVASPLAGASLAAGGHTIPLDTRGWRPGVYLCRLEVGAARRTTRLVVAR